MGHLYFAHDILQKEEIVKWKPRLIQSKQLNNLDCNKLFNIPGHKFLKDKAGAGGLCRTHPLKACHYTRYLVMSFLDRTRSVEQTRY